MKIHYIIIFIAIFTVSCKQNQNVATDDHGHSHDETLQLFAYNKHFEFFAEATPFIAGQTGDILAHFTHLENFKPLEIGRVTATMMVGTDQVSQTLEQPTRKGIYLFQMKPPVTGEGIIVFDLETPAGKSQIVVPGITVYRGEHTAHEAAAQAAITSSEGVAFTKEQSWKVDFATDEAVREPFGQMIRTIAQIYPSQGDERMIVAKASGTALFNTHITEGKGVVAGQTLFTIDGSGMADNNLAVRYTEAESEYNRAKAEYDRKAALAKDAIVSQSDLIAAKTELTNAEVIYNNLKSNFSAGKQNVASPIGGFVSRILVQNGEYVEAGQPVLVVSQNRDLLIKAEVQPKYFELLNHITTANIRIMNSNRTFTLEELGGRVLSYGRSTDVNNPLIPVLFQINNTSGLLPGSFVELFIKTQTNTQAITVPNGAIIEELGSCFVFVQLTPELFEKRAVKTGVTDGIRIEIKEGVTAGERVVSKGAILIKLSQSSGALDPHAGHVH